jgi:hypothetical protein
MGALADPEVTGVPFTVTSANEFVRVGVTVIDVVALGTQAV